MSRIDDPSFQARLARSRTLLKARREAFAVELAAAQAAAEAEESGYIEMTPEALIFAIETGEDPDEVSEDGLQTDL